MGKIKDAAMDDEGNIIPPEAADPQRESTEQLNGEKSVEQKNNGIVLTGIERDDPAENLGGEPGTFFRGDARNAAGRK